MRYHGAYNSLSLCVCVYSRSKCNKALRQKRESESEKRGLTKEIDWEIPQHRNKAPEKKNCIYKIHEHKHNSYNKKEICINLNLWLCELDGCWLCQCFLLDDAKQFADLLFFFRSATILARENYTSLSKPTKMCVPAMKTSSSSSSSFLLECHVSSPSKFSTVLYFVFVFFLFIHLKYPMKIFLVTYL